MRFRLVSLFFASVLSVLACHTALAAGERHALVIGNSAYQHTDPLTNPAKDAQLIASALEAAGFKVRLHVNLTQKMMKRAIRDFSRDVRTLGKDGVSLVYFAGHGTQVSGHNYLVPVDANIEYEGDVGIESIAVDQLLRQLEANEHALNIIILDACRNNPYRRGTRAATRGLAPIKAVKGSLIAYSTAPGTVARDGEGANSPYAAALDKYMRSPGLPIEKMFKQVRVEVDKVTSGQQTPWEESSLFGDFVFRSGKPASADRQHVSGGQTTSGNKRSNDTRLAAETTFWNTVRDSGNAAAVQSYLNAFPNGLFAPLAKIRLQKFKTEQKRVAARGHPAPQHPAPSRHRPRPRSASEDCLEHFRSDGKELVCVSSVLTAQSGNHYGVASLLDDSNYTSWFERKSNDGIGEWVTVSFDGPRRVKEVHVKNGYNKSEKRYFENNRVRGISVRFSDGRKRSIRLKDVPGLQRIPLPGNIVAEWVQLEITSVHRGSRYRDTGLNELRVVSEPADD